jgi:hypothetical protein
MRTTTILTFAAALFLAANAYAESANEQPAIAHAHYGRDGFWHCDQGYANGESGRCEVITNPSRSSAYTRLREYELTEQAQLTQAVANGSN